MKKKHIFKITIILLILLILFNFIIPPKVYADGESQTTGLDTFSGMMLEPTMEFFTFLVDSVMSILSGIMTKQDLEFVMQGDPINDQTNVGATVTIDGEEINAYKNFIGNLNVKYPNFPYSPEEIFSNKIELLDVNFISEGNTDTGWQKIREGVSSWYKVMRMVGIIGLLSVLIYTGIKIIISSSAQDKAKYKERILNWFIAAILLFSMHYIMAFILIAVEEFSTLLEGISGKVSVTMNGTTFTTNLIGLARFQMQQQHFSAKVGHFIIYVALVVFTFKFTFLYFKRVLNMAFLTLIAPIVALTYPIQKMDGKAEGFQLWLKEFMYNVLLQPMHYILYYILVSSSLTLSAKNPLYGIVAIGFIAHAEKLLKRIFGFGKAKGGTVGGIAGAYATGTVASAITGFITNPFHIGDSSSKKSSSSSGGGQSERGEDDEVPTGTINDTDFDSFAIEEANYNAHENNERNINESGENPEENNEPNNNSQNNDLDNDEIDNINIGRLNPDGTYIDLNGNMANIENTMGNYRDILSRLNIEFPELDFNDGDPRTLEDLLEQISLNQDKLKSAGLSDEEIEMLNEKIIGDKSIFKSRILLSELPFKLTDIPLQYLDNDRRSSEQISDDIFKYMEMAKQSKYTKSQRRSFSKKATQDMTILNTRLKENMYIDNIQRNINSTNLAAPNNQPNTAEVNNRRNESIHNISARNERRREQRANQQEESSSTARRIALGIDNVGRKIIKPVWDKEKSVEFNTDRLVRNIAKGAAGFAVGVATATVQAGISITDGKYKAIEGVGSLTAGAVAGTKIVGAIDNKIQENAREKETIEKYSKRWYDRDDVIKSYGEEYGDKSKEMRERARIEYVMRGIVDLEEQKQGMKFADELIREGKSQQEADKIAVATLRYRQELIQEKNYTLLYDNKKRNSYLEAKVEQYTGRLSREALLNRHMQHIENVRKFDRVNNT